MSYSRYDTDEVLADVLYERVRQVRKWGPQRHVPGKWLSILIEEVGEVAQEINDASEAGRELDWGEYRAELVQVAAVAVAAIEALDAEMGR